MKRGYLLAGMAVFVGLSCSAARRPADHSYRESQESIASDHGWCAKAEEHLDSLGCLTGLGEGEWSDICRESVGQHGVRQRLKAKCIASVSECGEIEDRCAVDTGNLLASGRRKTKPGHAGRSPDEAGALGSNAGNNPSQSSASLHDSSEIEISTDPPDMKLQFVECVNRDSDPRKGAASCMKKFPELDSDFVECTINKTRVLQKADMDHYADMSKRKAECESSDEELAYSLVGGNWPARCFDPVAEAGGDGWDLAMWECMESMSSREYADCLIAHRCDWRSSRGRALSSDSAATDWCYRAQERMYYLQCLEGNGHSLYWEVVRLDERGNVSRDFLDSCHRARGKSSTIVCISRASSCLEIRSKCKWFRYFFET